MMMRTLALTAWLCVGAFGQDDLPPQFVGTVDYDIASVLAFTEVTEAGECSLWAAGPGHDGRTLLSGAIDVAARRQVTSGAFAWAPSGGRIAFVSSGRQGTRGLYLGSETGGTPVLVADSLGPGEIGFSWAPSGDTIALWTADGRIYAVEARAGGTVAEISAAPALTPVWAAESDQLAFALRQPAGTIVVYDASSGRTSAFETRVANLSGRLRWSPAGGEILLESLDGLGEPSGLAVLDMRTGAVMDPGQGVTRPRFAAWAPSGRQLALVGALEGGLTGLFIASSPWTAAPKRVAGGAQDGLTVEGVGPDGDLWARWSPSGDALIYVAGPTDTVLHRWLYVAGAEGQAPRALSKPIECRDYAWSPDGQTVLFCGRRGSRGVLSSTAFAAPRDAGEADIRRLAPNVAFTSWSADGRCVAFITFDVYDRTKQLLQVTDMATGTFKRVSLSMEEFAWRPVR